MADNNMSIKIVDITKKDKPWKGYNSCYMQDADDDSFIKPECEDCPHCYIEDIWFQAMCNLKTECQFG